MPSPKAILEKADTRDPATEFFALLHALDDGEELLPDHRANPEVAFRFVYDGWVKRGGFERGKPRHSARQIKAWLPGSSQIRSLETKLAGKTWLQYLDALNLLKLFLSKWTYHELGNSYSPYAEGDLDSLARNLLQELFLEGVKALLLPERSRKTKSEAKNETAATLAQPAAFELTKPSGDTIQELFADSDVLVTISRVRSVIGSRPPDAMTGFHGLMERLYSLDKKDRRKRALIWIIDLGLRNDKTAARGAIYNVHFLAAQFQSIALIERERREDLYSWLHKNACVIVGSLEQAEIDWIYDQAKVKLPPEQGDLRWFQSDRLFLESVPGRWLDPPGSDAFGDRQRELWQSPTITVHLRLEDWDLHHSPELDTRKNVRYLYHGEAAPSGDDPESQDIRCIALEEPGSRWSDAYRLAIQGALGRLDRRWDERVSPVAPHEALAQLRDQSFAVLKLDEFLHLPDLLIQQAYLKEN